jgi:hypothetical protein
MLSSSLLAACISLPVPGRCRSRPGSVPELRQRQSSSMSRSRQEAARNDGQGDALALIQWIDCVGSASFRWTYPPGVPPASWDLLAGSLAGVARSSSMAVGGVATVGG